MAKLSNIKRCNEPYDASEFFDGDEPVVFGIGYFTKGEEMEISALRIEGQKMKINPETEELDMGAENFVINPANMARIQVLTILYGVNEDSNPLDEPWNEETVQAICKDHPGLANALEKAVMEVNRPLKRASSMS